MPERPAPFVLVTTPPEGQPFGSHAAIAADGQRLLAADLSHRFGRLGAAVSALPSTQAGGFHWGHWFVDAARSALASAAGPVDAIGYAGGGALCLLADDALDALLSPVAGEVVANNRFSADAFVVAGDLDRALDALVECETDNAAARRLNEAGFEWRDLGEAAWTRFDVDTTLDLALLRLATRLPGTRPLDGSLRSFLEMARLPGDRALEVPHLARIGEVIRDRSAELVVAGRVPVSTWQELETETACRVRGLVEERGMRSARDPGSHPRSILASLMAHSSPTALVEELARLGDAVVLDTRVLMAAVGGSSDASAWPPEEDRFASDFGDHARVATPWLRELTEAAGGSPIPILFGGHALISDGLRLMVAAAWQGR
ncbi:MAG TPA: hypothetical protein VEW95_03900 [Candidatus Limnocylindrales bacterium]|nr:hypothetical protein [Candidatus Limnocylindrales bacterium]